MIGTIQTWLERMEWPMTVLAFVLYAVIVALLIAIKVARRYVRPVAPMVVLLAIASPAHAQFGFGGMPVIDAANLAVAGDIHGEAINLVREGLKQNTTLLEMFAFPADLTGYRVPTIRASRPDPSRYQLAGDLLEMFYSGDPRDERYRRSVRPLPDLGPMLARTDLSPSTKRAIQQTYALAQVQDMVIPRAAHQNALYRNFDDLWRVLDANQDDVTSSRNATKHLTAAMNKTAVGQHIENRIHQQGIASDSHELELVLSRGLYLRNDYAASVAFTMGAVTDGRAAARSQIAGATRALEQWRLP